jgi:CheY-like chemotaxis protein
MMAQGIIQPGERVVVNCSGHTFSAEKHVLEDRYVLSLETRSNPADHCPVKGLTAALKELDEQVTTIVVVDDNPHDNRLIRRLLQSCKQYRVFEAYNGRDGIDLARQRQPDLIVLDLSLPDMDGASVLGTLKADPRTSNIPVIVVSAQSPAPKVQTFLQCHTDSIWQKGGFSAQELVSHVVHMLGGDGKELGTSFPSGDLSTLSDFGQGHRPRILIVEDNAFEARLMRRLFELRQRFQVVEVRSGAEALAAAEQAPDLIILDLVLPDMTGEQLLAQLRANEKTRNVPVLVVTAKDLDPDTRTLLAAEANSVWLKGSLDRNSLLAQVETILPE